MIQENRDKVDTTGVVVVDVIGMAVDVVGMAVHIKGIAVKMLGDEGVYRRNGGAHNIIGRTAGITERAVDII